MTKYNNPFNLVIAIHSKPFNLKPNKAAQAEPNPQRYKALYVLTPEKGIYFESPEQAEAVAVHFLQDYVRPIATERQAQNSERLRGLSQTDKMAVAQEAKEKLQILCSFPSGKRWAIETETNDTPDFEPYFRTLYGNIGKNQAIKADIFICLAGNQPAQYEIKNDSQKSPKQVIPFKISEFLKDPKTETPYPIELIPHEYIKILKARYYADKYINAPIKFGYNPSNQDGEDVPFG